ncbi:MAG: hypothetical protein US50_C0009G0007 [Candidatus Nomurabacteria bacterium GW2011_GWB1_37_5]|uniref:Uncharacterized protein n=1 Tax=Candidatus Nomurabacteria bacterium GW2011_GWB1_37_5 TaxID=1618742 RepID=A0A0G0K4T9_9BACT|nr:MAG: hypothetical protein US50_C0009G0007 [Candidatus Nomurabacteria bacterium GW2011_GWB1_37_5]
MLAARCQKILKANNWKLTATHKMIYVIKKIILLSMFGILLLPIFVSAQTADDISISLTPENPGPNQSVTATIQSFMFDLNKSMISWYVGGKSQISGIGKINFTFTAPASGQIALEARITPQGGDQVIKTTGVTVSDIDLIWQGINVLVPPFYKGRSLPVQEGEVKVVAIPKLLFSGINLKPEDFTYEWKRNFTTESEGFAKNYLVFQNDFSNNSEQVEVSASPVKNEVVINKGESITLGQPEIVFYEKDLALGTHYNRALNQGSSLQKNETLLVAFPYFFSGDSIFSNELKYQWFLNDQELTGFTENEIPIKSGQSPGQTKITAKIEARKKLFQSVNQSIIIKY